MERTVFGASPFGFFCDREIQRRGTAKFANLNARDFAVASHFLKSLGMNSEETDRFITVEQRLEQCVVPD